MTIPVYSICIDFSKRKINKKRTWYKIFWVILKYETLKLDYEVCVEPKPVAVLLRFSGAGKFHAKTSN
jgi:hypothetical protein